MLVEGRPLILGGVLIPYDRGLLGHSDADAVCHAVTDALLGAANLGDIGRLFPDTDPAWKDADSMRLLADAWTRVRAAGFTLGNLDIVVIAQQPKIGPHADAIQARPGAVLDVPADQHQRQDERRRRRGRPRRGDRRPCRRADRAARRSMIVYGAHAAFEALRAGRATRLSLVARPARRRPNRRMADLVAEAKRAGVPVDTISEEQASRLSSGRPHQGVIAEVQAPDGLDAGRPGRRGRHARRCSSSSTASRIRTTWARSCAPPTRPASTA